MNSGDWDYCVAALPRVSRTFALNIQILSGELHRAVLIAYLWARIIDTVEDAPQFPADRKVAALSAFADHFDRDRISLDQITQWARSLSDLDGTTHELELVQSTDKVGRCHLNLNGDMQRAMRSPIATMARGMADYQERGEVGRTELLRDESDLDQYCYYVAGTVGEMLTSLFLLRGQPSQKRVEMLNKHAVSFGLGLQLTNIAKDVMIDRSRGWCYIPRDLIEKNGATVPQFLDTHDPALSRTVLNGVITKALKHLDEGLNYTQNIPRSWRQIRLFCIWPLLMAYQTLHLLSQPGFEHQGSQSPKISRKEVGRIVRQSSFWFWSNSWLGRQRPRILLRDRSVFSRPGA